jgi:hypothetical protein
MKRCKKCGVQANWSSADCPICFGDLESLSPSDAVNFSALLVQKASAGGMTGGRRGGSRIPHCPAMLSIGGIVWTSPLPETDQQADFYNGSADRINAQTSRKNQTDATKQQQKPNSTPHRIDCICAECFNPSAD